MNKPKNIELCLIDADIVAYGRACSAKGCAPIVAVQKVDNLMDWIIGETVDWATKENFRAYLTGSNNYRYSIREDYKGNRKATEKPEHLGTCRDRIVDHWGGVICEGKEADDQLATDVTNFGNPEEVVIVSTDKDMKTVNCWHFNPVTGEWFYADELHALQFFYQQILMGDRADNIHGIDGIGPKKAEKLLLGLTDEADMYSVCLETYADTFEGSLDEKLEQAEAKVLENGRLLRLQRYEGELWGPDV